MSAVQSALDKGLYSVLGIGVGAIGALIFFNHQEAVPSLLAVVVGLVTSSVELLKKYSIGTSVRSLLGCLWTWFYLLVNAAMSLAALVLLQDGGLFKEGGRVGDHVNHSAILMALAAGLGAMMVLRSSIITIRTHGRDFPVGPALLLDALQEQIEHRVDQARAARSFQEVSDLMEGVPATPGGMEVALLALHALERLKPETQVAVKQEIKKLLRDEGLTDGGKAVAIGISVRKVAGLEVLRKVVSVVRKRRPLEDPGTGPGAGGQKCEGVRSKVEDAMSTIPD